jgi:hypothetical protein
MFDVAYYEEVRQSKQYQPTSDYDAKSATDSRLETAT